MAVSELSEEAKNYFISLEDRKILDAIPVPTYDAHIRIILRHLGKPITFFGEKPEDRRERLRKECLVLLKKGENIQTLLEQPFQESSDNEEDEEFYTPGGDELLHARLDIAKESIHNAKKRLLLEKRQADNLSLEQVLKARKNYQKSLEDSNYSMSGSKIVADRAISIVRISPDDEIIAAGSWNGQVKLLEPKNLETIREYNSGHFDKVGGIAWCRNTTTDPSTLSLCSSGADGIVCGWSLNDSSPLFKLKGHEGLRIVRCEAHPNGKYLGSVGFDASMTLWDLEKLRPVLVQPGHCRELYALNYQLDGSLCVTGGFDTIGRVWDLRTGRTIMILEGHSQSILALDFRNGHQIASGSQDSSIKIWDIRKVKEIHTIPAHTSNVSDLRFMRGYDYRSKSMSEISALSSEDIVESSRSRSFMVSSGYDGKLNVWSSDDYILRASMAMAEPKVMSCDVSSNMQFMVAATFDRSVKIWSNQS